MDDINLELESLIREMQEVGELPAKQNGGKLNSLLRYKELRDRILEKFLSAFESGYRLTLNPITPQAELRHGMRSGREAAYVCGADSVY